ncbi:MAG: ATP-binding protein [Betaproteobacteria bacterium]
MLITAHTRPIRMLHLEASEQDHELVKFALRRSGGSFDVQRTQTLGDFCTQIAATNYDVILSDYRFADFTAIDALNEVTQLALRPPFILLSRAIGETAAVDALKHGINDYVLKDNLSNLVHVIGRAIEVRDSRMAKARADAELAASQKRMAKLTAHLQLSIEQERASIAREVHDDIGGALAAMKFDLAWMGRHANDPAAQMHIAAASEMLQHALGASQRIIRNLRPAILDQGLVAAIQWMATGFEKRTGIKTVLRATQESVKTSNEVQLVAYRTAQEALTNISKYAQCTAVSIDVSDHENVLTVEISDNGRGISHEDLEKASAFGIKGLRERAKTVGGWLDISRNEGAGTSVIVSIPLHDPAALSPF